jgi:hypothetical protein
MSTTPDGVVSLTSAIRPAGFASAGFGVAPSLGAWLAEVWLEAATTRTLGPVRR